MKCYCRNTLSGLAEYNAVSVYTQPGPALLYSNFYVLCELIRILVSLYLSSCRPYVFI